ncbi:MAG: hypothetical protein R3D03_14250 [Geminicoccaceae bacterium]
MASRLLDVGAVGIVVPHVDSRPEEIEPFVDRCRFALQVTVRWEGVPQLDYEALPAPGHGAGQRNFDLPDDRKPEGGRECRSDRGRSGVDILLFGTNDLAIEMGIPGQLDHPRIAEAYRTVIDAARAEGKFVGLGGVYSRSSSNATCRWASASPCSAPISRSCCRACAAPDGASPVRSEGRLTAPGAFRPGYGHRWRAWPVR